jgi:DNA-binding transcriptional ArsR family regulator
MDESTLDELGNLFLALSDKTRLRLLALMADGEVPVGFLADKLGESQPKVSRHLAYLRNLGLVSTRREGKWIFYAIENQNDAAVIRILDATLGSMLVDYNDRNVRSYAVHYGDAYRPYDDQSNMLPDAYVTDWVPNEIPIFLL